MAQSHKYSPFINHIAATRPKPIFNLPPSVLIDVRSRLDQAALELPHIPNYRLQFILPVLTPPCLSYYLPYKPRRPRTLQLTLQTIQYLADVVPTFAPDPFKPPRYSRWRTTTAYASMTLELWGIEWLTLGR